MPISAQLPLERRREAYAAEELIAELAAAFLALLGIEEELGHAGI